MTLLVLRRFLSISPEGKVPVAKVDHKWIADSNVITQTVEEKFPDPSRHCGSKIFSTDIGFLKSKYANDGTEQALLNEPSAFNDYIKENVGSVLSLHTRTYISNCLLN
ncbi:putative glutathione dehydrogenase (ascorbate) [Helianthus annuus]|nr:putative glutathione dehydrogenase (ascorbate) [Helianthus annuus]